MPFRKKDEPDVDVPRVNPEKVLDMTIEQICGNAMSEQWSEDQLFLALRIKETQNIDRIMRYLYWKYKREGME